MTFKHCPECGNTLAQREIAEKSVPTANAASVPAFRFLCHA